MQHFTAQTDQLGLHRLHQLTAGVGQAQAFGATIKGILGAADIPGVAQLIEQTHQRRTLHPRRLRHRHLPHTLAQAPDHQQRDSASFGNAVVDQRGLADFAPMPRGHHHGTAEVHLKGVEGLGHKGIRIQLVR
ncbi:hypothetical protein D3C84_923130 [compost metagenome]